MTFSEFALELSAYISFGKSERDYFTELVGNFIQDAAMDSCKLLKRKPAIGRITPAPCGL